MAYNFHIIALFCGTIFFSIIWKYSLQQPVFLAIVEMKGKLLHIYTGRCSNFQNPTITNNSLLGFLCQLIWQDSLNESQLDKLTKD